MLIKGDDYRSDLQLISPEGDPELWDAYVQRHEKGTIFHTAGMHQVFSHTPSMHPWSRAAVDDSGKIVAMLNSVRVETLKGLASRIASRAIFYCEPICEQSKTGTSGLELLIEEHDRQMRHRVLFTEIRPVFKRGAECETLEKQGHQYQDYLNYVVHLDCQVEELTRNLSKSCRKQIQKCKKRGVRILNETTPESIDEMYRLVQHSYDRSQVPLADVSLFQNALKFLGKEVVEVRQAIFENKVVSTGITLKFRDRVYAWYGGSLRVTGLTPFALLTWDEIESGSREGFKYYDFGGAGWPGEEYGPRDFKSKFGGELVDYGRYRKIVAPLRLAAAETAYQSARKLKGWLRSFKKKSPATESVK